jgi:hypothetical protein
MTNWSGGLVEWTSNNTAYISVVFSWQLQEAYQRVAWYKASGYKVKVGGTAVDYNPAYFTGIADHGNNVNALQFHNPDATFTTRGCIRKCPFCIVPIIEGEFREIHNFIPKPIVCDNNFLASSKAHFDRVMDRLKPLKHIDFNQGLDARLLNNYMANRLAELDLQFVRLAFDNTKTEKEFLRAYQLLLDAGVPAKKIRVYCLIGFMDTPEDAIYRLELIRSLGSMPNPARYQPLNAKKRNCYVDINWTEKELKDISRYYSRLVWLGHIKFEDYNAKRVAL